jgi:hypothetical protein
MSIEHEKLKAEAKPLGLFVGVHREWTSGPYFVSVWKEPKNQLAKFQTAAQVRALFARYEPGKPLPPPVKDDDVTELSVLQRKARPLGFHVAEHKQFDPCRGNGPYFVVPKRRNKQEGYQPTLLRYATAQEVTDFLNREAENYAA